MSTPMLAPQDGARDDGRIVLHLGPRGLLPPINAEVLVRRVAALSCVLTLAVYALALVLAWRECMS